MDETPDSRGLGGSQQRRRAGHVGRKETCQRRRIDGPGDVDHRIRTLAELGELAMLVERARPPLDIGPRQLGSARQRTDLMAAFGSHPQHMAAEKAGAAGDGQNHSSTIWSRWTSAERGA